MSQGESLAQQRSVRCRARAREQHSLGQPEDLRARFGPTHRVAHSLQGFAYGALQKSPSACQRGMAPPPHATQCAEGGESLMQRTRCSPQLMRTRRAAPHGDRVRVLESLAQASSPRWRRLTSQLKDQYLSTYLPHQRACRLQLRYAHAQASRGRGEPAEPRAQFLLRRWSARRESHGCAPPSRYRETHVHAVRLWSPTSLLLQAIDLLHGSTEVTTQYLRHLMM
ncbi:unannotated protein [freshwater metagenome]|uniref:Unannotated protein n=1 Tax=freshwater metagenome TaxID=449393 RepID=A0A6J7L0Q2_9ZZZZ